MASPRKIISSLNKVSLGYFSVSSKVQRQNSPKVNQHTVLNINTPNRSKIVNEGLSDKKFKVIGVGGFGTVYQATYKDVDVAAKILKHSYSNDEVIAAEMLRVDLKHKNIVRLIGFDQGKTLSMLMLELCGPCLHHVIEERPLSKEERISFLHDISQALKYCHNANIIHTDVKPTNIFITKQKQAKLGDFGSSVIYNKTNKNKITIKGTAGYEAPEIIRGKNPIPASDVYSLGVVAWQMLSRRKPFSGYHCHVILYLTGKGYKPEKNEFLDDGFKGEYKKMYRTMWSTNNEDRPNLIQVLRKLKYFYTLINDS